MSEIELEAAHRLSRDIRTAAKTLSHAEARYLVDSYYQMQRNRIRAGNQIHSMQADKERPGEPHLTLSWLMDNADLLERNIKSALDAYSSAHVVGQWSKSITGIGPVIAAGLLAHIDITRAKTAGQIWRFAGLDPTVRWGKGQKRPWNGSLKRLCWIIGESFVKVSSNDNDVYGHLYVLRKAYEQQKNAAGDYAQQAKEKLENFKIGKDTDAFGHYTEGRLPPARIHERSKRWAVKLFLAHWHSVAYRAHFGQDAPKPYVITQLHHAHEVVCPNWPFPADEVERTRTDERTNTTESTVAAE